MRKHDRDLKRLAKAHGFAPLPHTGKSHRRFGRDGLVVIAPSTPSDHRWRQNFRQFIKRKPRNAT
jgi:hypothetical protein